MEQQGGAGRGRRPLPDAVQVEQVLARQLHVAQAGAVPVPGCAAAAACPRGACRPCRRALLRVELAAANAAVADRHSHPPAGAQGEGNAVRGNLRVGGWRGRGCPVPVDQGQQRGEGRMRGAAAGWVAACGAVRALQQSWLAHSTCGAAHLGRSWAAQGRCACFALPPPHSHG